MKQKETIHDGDTVVAMKLTVGVVQVVFDHTVWLNNDNKDLHDHFDYAYEHGDGNGDANGDDRNHRYGHGLWGRIPLQPRYNEHLRGRLEGALTLRCRAVDTATSSHKEDGHIAIDSMPTTVPSEDLYLHRHGNRHDRDSENKASPSFSSSQWRGQREQTFCARSVQSIQCRNISTL